MKIKIINDHNNRFFKIPAAILAALVALTQICAPAAVYAYSVSSNSSAEGTSGAATLVIGNLKELNAFAAKCSSDDYSRGLNVMLADDINVEGLEVSVPVFFGSFDGQGHSIYGLKLTESNSEYGLFSRIGSGATVKALNVQGEVIPDGTQENIGGIAGINAGTIENCSFSGVVSADSCAGGMAGKNESGALIADCSVTGTVRGKNFTGGMTGHNAGTVMRCKNSAYVNTTVSDIDIGVFGSSGLEENVYDLLKNKDSDENIKESAVTSDAGGIAGYSTGIIQSCENSGSVGYPHVGYNVGGIVGRQNGYLASCINRGSVQGRKDVGGIAGQMSPDITLKFDDDDMNELQDRLDVMKSLVDAALNDVQATSDTVSGRMTNISDLAGDAGDIAHSLSGRLSDFTDDNIAVVNNITLIAERYVSKAEPITDKLSEASDYISEMMDRIDDLSDSVKGLDKYTDTVLKNIQYASSEASEASGDIKSAFSHIDKAFSYLRGGSAAEQLKLDSLKNAADEIRAALKVVESASGHMESAMSYMSDAVKEIRSADGQVDDIMSDMDRVTDSAQDAADSLSLALSKASQWIEDLSNEDPGEFSELGDDFDGDSDALNNVLNGINSEMSALNSEISDAGTSLVDDMREINDEFRNIMDLFSDMLDDVKNFDTDDLYEDVSEEYLRTVTRGKVLECTNYGDVTGDRNAGGIAGSMAVEYDLDPEDDLLSAENRSVKFTYQTKAIMLDCSNYGNINVKKSCAGGTVGRMELGTVFGCGGYGDVSSENGDYVGGVCGLSISAVRNSYAKCGLSGRKYVGGIAGSGKRVSGCRSMVYIDECEQYGGAVAGEVTDTCSGNFFVSDELAGLDRVSWTGKAENVSYETLCAMSGLPDEFRKLTLRFVYEGKTVKTQKFDYGASFTDDVFPDVTADDDCYVSWDKTDLSDLRCDTVVTGESQRYVTTLASSQERKGRPVILAQGNFEEDDSLSAEKSNNMNVSGTVAERWSIELPDDGADTHTVRWLVPDDFDGEKLAVYVDTGSGQNKADTELNGSYLCFDMTGSGDFTVTQSAGSKTLAIAVAAVLCALAAAAAAGISARKRKKRN